MKSVVARPSVDRIFRAFSDRTRLRILNLLRPGELCVCDLVRVLGSPQPKISRHLAYLRRAGLVEGRKEGLWMHYSLSPANNRFHEKVLECLSCCFTDVPELARDAKRRGECAAAKKCAATDGFFCRSIFAYANGVGFDG